MIGIDFENSKRFETWSEQNLIRVFTKNEIEYSNKFKNKFEHLCGFYCVKEALVKALNDSTLNFKEIEVLHTASNKPYINSKYLKNLIAEVSISHSNGYAVAIVQIEKTKEKI